MYPTLQCRQDRLVSQYWLIDSLVTKGEELYKVRTALGASGSDIQIAQQFHQERKKIGRKYLHALVTKIKSPEELPLALQHSWTGLEPSLRHFLERNNPVMEQFGLLLQKRWDELQHQSDKLHSFFAQADISADVFLFLIPNPLPEKGGGQYIETSPVTITLMPKVVKGNLLSPESVDANLAIVVHEILHSLEYQIRTRLQEQFNEEAKKNDITDEEDLVFGLCIEAILSCLAPKGILSREMGISVQEHNMAPQYLEPFSQESFHSWKKALTNFLRKKVEASWAEKEPLLKTNIMNMAVSWYASKQ